jgi:hypothetical protein
MGLRANEENMAARRDHSLADIVYRYLLDRRYCECKKLLRNGTELAQGYLQALV